MNMRFWRDWVFLWALMPLFSSFLVMAFNKRINDNDPMAWLHDWGAMAVLILSLALFLYAPYFVIRRHLPHYRAVIHFGLLLSILAGWIFLGLLSIKGIGGVQLDSWLQLAKSFNNAAIRLRFDAPVTIPEILALPWWKLYFSKLVMTVSVLAIPTLIICVVAGRRHSFSV